jgi:hypothetical protein
MKLNKILEAQEINDVEFFDKFYTIYKRNLQQLVGSGELDFTNFATQDQDAHNLFVDTYEAELDEPFVRAAEEAAGVPFIQLPSHYFAGREILLKAKKAVEKEVLGRVIE